MKYIDADKLKAEIEIIQQSLESRDVRLNQIKKIRTECSIEFCKCIIDVIDSFQQECSDTDLGKEIDSEWAKCNPIDEGMGVEVANIHIEAFDIIARHFYELGLNARKEN